MIIKGLACSMYSIHISSYFSYKYKINHSFMKKFYYDLEGWKILVNPKSLCRETLLGINPLLRMKRIFPKNKL